MKLIQYIYITRIMFLPLRLQSEHENALLTITQRRFIICHEVYFKSE